MKKALLLLTVSFFAYASTTWDEVRAYYSPGGGGDLVHGGELLNPESLSEHAHVKRLYELYRGTSECRQLNLCPEIRKEIVGDLPVLRMIHDGNMVLVVYLFDETGDEEIGTCSAGTVDTCTFIYE